MIGVRITAMYTFCPGCAAIFRITAETVSAAGGQVRCGECDRVFNAVDCLYDDAVTARHAALMATGQGLPVANPPQPSVTQEYVPETVVAEALRRPLPDAGWARQSPTPKGLAGGLAVGLLVLVLGLQWVYFNRGMLAGDTGLRPALERFCEVLHCQLPLRIDLAKLEIIDRDVRKHPQEESALLINASIANRAAFNQPYPVFEISFSDVAGNPVAMRRFLPGEYLEEATDTAAGMAPDVPVKIVLQVRDPGDEAVSFQFGFL
ncbi:MAG TPA: zinc-ribbon and DUF3426 domain-containing protein [Gammaproteobacteria bacterium]|nr:zinc-ribbon and DUF3426 domain-containing protein [Gammaproteobacteria bacterium]